MNILSKLLATDGFITVNKALIKAYGLNEAVIIGELCSEYNYWNEHSQLKDDKFYSSRENIEENTGLSKHLQRKALEHLIDEGIVEVYKEGMPATNYYKINFNKLLTVFTTSDEWCEPQVVNGVNLNNNINNKNKEKQSISKDIDYIDNKPSFEFGKTNQPKQSLYSFCMASIYNFTTDTVLQNKLKEFVDSLSEMKKLKGQKQFTSILNKLKEYGKTDEERIRIIDYSIEHGYGTFYKLEDKPLRKSGTADINKRVVRATKEQKEAIRSGKGTQY